jgi:hypothetical protein
LTLWRDPSRFDPWRGSSPHGCSRYPPQGYRCGAKETTLRLRLVAAPEAVQDGSSTSVPGADQTAMARMAAGQLRAALHNLPVVVAQARMV